MPAPSFASVAHHHGAVMTSSRVKSGSTFNQTNVDARFHRLMCSLARLVRPDSAAAAGHVGLISLETNDAS